MITAQGDDTRGFLRNPVRMAVVAVFLIIVSLVVFFSIATHRLRRELRAEPPPAGSTPTAPGPVVPQ